MNTGLSDREFELMRHVFSQFEPIRTVILFGSRAKGNFRANSDIDLAIVLDCGDLSGEVDAFFPERVSLLLDDLPMPFHFDVQLYQGIHNAALLSHIDRVGIPIYERQEQCG